MGLARQKPGAGDGAPPNSSNRQEPKMIKNFLHDETGLELSEYAVAAALVTLAVVAAFGTLGANIKAVIENMAGYIK
jgi:pilus assembly protein Flp/PilA